MQAEFKNEGNKRHSNGTCKKRDAILLGVKAFSFWFPLADWFPFGVKPGVPLSTFALPEVGNASDF